MTMVRATFSKTMGKKTKVAKVMGEFKRGTLHSGSKKGKKVTSHAQAIAIALREAGYPIRYKK